MGKGEDRGGDLALHYQRRSDCLQQAHHISSLSRAADT